MNFWYCCAWLYQTVFSHPEFGHFKIGNGGMVFQIVFQQSIPGNLEGFHNQRFAVIARIDKPFAIPFGQVLNWNQFSCWYTCLFYYRARVSNHELCFGRLWWFFPRQWVQQQIFNLLMGKAQKRRLLLCQPVFLRPAHQLPVALPAAGAGELMSTIQICSFLLRLCL